MSSDLNELAIWISEQRSFHENSIARNDPFIQTHIEKLRQWESALRRLASQDQKPVAWRSADDVPHVSKGQMREYVVAVRRARTGKVHTFSACYLNAYPLEYRDCCPKGVGCDGNGCDDGCPTTGWFDQTGDDYYDSMFNPLSLGKDDVLMGWRELPQWGEDLSPPPAAGWDEFKPTQEQVNSACVSYRHDFGLLDATGQQTMRWMATEWLRAWQKEFAYALPPAATKSATDYNRGYRAGRDACIDWLGANAYGTVAAELSAAINVPAGAGKSAPPTVSTLPSGERDPSVMSDHGGADDGVRVKPLEWEALVVPLAKATPRLWRMLLVQPDGPEGTAWLGHGTDMCQYYIRFDAETESYWMPGEIPSHGDDGFAEEFPTLEEAKAAAQADYERRILSALSYQPAPVAANASAEATGYAERLAVALWEKHYKTDADQWKPLSGDLIGILTQIDNMTAGLSRTTPAATNPQGCDHNYIPMPVGQNGEPVHGVTVDRQFLYAAAMFCQWCNHPQGVQPAATKPDTAGVAVKPLEWVEREGVAGTFDASTSIGHYIASITDDGRGHWFITGLTRSNYTDPNIESVKAAAQADYERRILSALTNQPAPVAANASAEARLRVIDECSDALGYRREYLRTLLSAHPHASDCDKHGCMGDMAPGDMGDMAPGDPKDLAELLAKPSVLEPSDRTADRRQIVARDRHWSVTVAVNGETMITIERNCLSGAPDVDDDIIRTCARHLLGFIGEDA